MKGKLATVSVEVWCDHTLYIWSWIAGRAATNNDRTLLSFSYLLNAILSGTFAIHLPTPYHLLASGRGGTLPYIVPDGIYRSWLIFALLMHYAPTTTQ